MFLRCLERSSSIWARRSEKDKQLGRGMTRRGSTNSWNSWEANGQTEGISSRFQTKEVLFFCLVRWVHVVRRSKLTYDVFWRKTISPVSTRVSSRWLQASQTERLEGDADLMERIKDAQEDPTK